MPHYRRLTIRTATREEHPLSSTAPDPTSVAATAPDAAAARDGSHDFDPFLGRWVSHNRKLRDTLDPACTEWVEFDGVVDSQPILGGLGNVEFGQFDHDPPFEGLSLRLYDPEAALWRIWWASTRQPGQVGPPVEGRFDGDGRGVFISDEDLGGRPGKVRYEWIGMGTDSPRWRQAFSYDGGRTWAVNWSATFTRGPGRSERSGT